MNQDKRSGYTSLLVKQIDNSGQTPHQLEPISNLPTLTLKLYPTILKFSFVSMITVGVILSSLILPSKLAAIPAFARKHGKPCQTCHVSEPKLNAFGELFRANGYQLPGTIEDTPPWSMRQIVMAAMLHEMVVDRKIESKMRAVPPPGLPNRSLMNKKIENAITSAAKDDSFCCGRGYLPKPFVDDPESLPLC
ncbi:MAG TPA: hypothetical protein EYO79_01755 [Candidatus Marinimicrobia bacterium]|nr:hypothetical protein [Candidatus Neomarinimicrobiota bacterium]